MTKPERVSELLTPKQVAEALQKSVFTVRRLIKQGKLPAFKVGNAWRIPRVNLEKFIREQKYHYGLIAVGSTFYRSAVLDKYKTESEKYYLHDQAFSGKLGLRYHLAYRWGKYNPRNIEPAFAELRYQKVPLKNGETAVVINPKESEKIKSIAEEQLHWRKYLIEKPEFE